MKIAFAVEHFDGTKGGAEKYVWNFAKWLIEKGHSLDVFTMDNYVEMPGANIRVLDLHSAQGASRQLRFGNALQKELSGREYDIVQGFNHAWPADVLMLHGGVHLAYEQFNALSSPTRMGQWLKQLTYRVQRKYRALRRNEQIQFGDASRHYIAVSQRVAEDMRQYYPAVAERIHVIYPGTDTSRCRGDDQEGIRDRFRKEVGTPSGRSVFLFVSHNFRLKGLHDLLKVMPKVLREEPNAELWVVGRGRSRAFMAEARRHGVAEHVRFLGMVDDIHDAYAAADVLVHPSYYDTFGGVCMEAAGSGMPVVMSRNCGASELLHGERGVFTFDMPVADEEVIADAMLCAKRLEWSAEDRVRLARLAENWSAEKNYCSVLSLYETGLKTPSLADMPAV